MGNVSWALTILWIAILSLSGTRAFTNDRVASRRGCLLLSMNSKFPEVEKCLKRVDKYKSNIDMLAGRTAFGSPLFKDASLSLHNVKTLSANEIETRWTLQFTFKILPGQPRPRFTGVSQYTLNDEGLIIEQRDFWDSINLVGGEYRSASKQQGIADFLGQLKSEDGAEMNAPELPYELLRRAPRYEVRRYPEAIVVQTAYTKRPEGYDRLGSYVSGSNEGGKKLSYFTPTLMKVSDDSDGKRRKTMQWPLSFRMPGGAPLSTADQQQTAFPVPTLSGLKFKTLPERVVAVCRFQVPATEVVVRGYTQQLLNDVKSDKMKPTVFAEDGGCIVGQYDALFSLNKRRNEVWVDLEDHPWL